MGFDITLLDYGACVFFLSYLKVNGQSFDIQHLIVTKNNGSLLILGEIQYLSYFIDVIWRMHGYAIMQGMYL